MAKISLYKQGAPVFQVETESGKEAIEAFSLFCDLEKDIIAAREVAHAEALQNASNPFEAEEIDNIQS